jgi:hypothetical protein
LRRLFIALAGTLDRPLHGYGKERLEKVTQAAVTQQLHPMLSGTDRPTADELKGGTWRVIGPLLELSEEEREYSDRLQLGELRPELLFPDDERQAEVLRNHPALLWKVRNAQTRARESTEKRRPTRR